MPSTLLCRVLRVARSAYYAWARRGVSARAQADADSPPRSRRRTRGAAGRTARPASTPSCKRRGALRPQARGPPDARRRARRLPPAHASAHDRRRPGPGCPPRTWSLAIARQRAGPAMAGESPLCRPGRAGATWRCCSMHTRAGSSAGRWPTTCAPRLPLAALLMALGARRPPPRPRAPYRSRLPVHGGRVSGSPDYPSQHRLLDESVGRLSRQRDGRKLLLNPQGRTPPHAPVADAGGGAHGGLRVARGLVQPTAPPLRPWLSPPRRP